MPITSIRIVAIGQSSSTLKESKPYAASAIERSLQVDNDNCSNRKDGEHGRGLFCLWQPKPRNRVPAAYAPTVNSPMKYSEHDK